MLWVCRLGYIAFYVNQTWIKYFKWFKYFRCSWFSLTGRQSLHFWVTSFVSIVPRSSTPKVLFKYTANVTFLRTAFTFSSPVYVKVWGTRDNTGGEWKNVIFSALLTHCKYILLLLDIWFTFKMTSIRSVCIYQMCKWLETCHVSRSHTCWTNIA